MHKPLRILAAALLALVTVSASAATVTRYFEVTLDAQPSAVHRGWYSVDDAGTDQAPAGANERWLAVSDFAFDFLGVGYGLADLDFAHAVFALDGSFLGLDAAASAGRFAFVPAAFGSEAFFAYQPLRGAGGNGSIVTAPAVPAPPALALAMLALAAAAAVRRRGAE